jgi:hypothetical protein
MLIVEVHFMRIFCLFDFDFAYISKRSKTDESSDRAEKDSRKMFRFILIVLHTKQKAFLVQMLKMKLN